MTTNMNQVPAGQPEYQYPEPSRRQKLARRGAGMLLGAGRKAGPEVIADMIATEIGGYEAKEPSTIGGKIDGPTKYVHREANQVPIVAAQDETTGIAHVMMDKTSAAFNDRIGTDLVSAAESALSGRRDTGPKAGTLRGGLAKKAMRYGTRGVGVGAHLRKS